LSIEQKYTTNLLSYRYCGYSLRLRKGHLDGGLFFPVQLPLTCVLNINRGEFTARVLELRDEIKRITDLNDCVITQIFSLRDTRPKA